MRFCENFCKMFKIIRYGETTVRIIRTLPGLMVNWRHKTWLFLLSICCKLQKADRRIVANVICINTATQSPPSPVLRCRLGTTRHHMPLPTSGPAYGSGRAAAEIWGLKIIIELSSPMLQCISLLCWETWSPSLHKAKNSIFMASC